MIMEVTILVNTTIEIDDALWRIVILKAGKEDRSRPEALEQILHSFIEEHGKEYGYPAEELKRGDD